MKALASILLFLLICCSCSSSYQVIEGHFENDGITFSSNIYKPNGEGPFPAVVMVHGSKNHTGDFYTEYSEYFAKNGIVTLNYANRGHGDSEGNLWTSTFHDLGADVSAAIEHLSSLPYVDANRVGTWADSHGGWIVLIADSLSHNMDFIISKAGPAVTPLETVYFDVKNNYLIPQGVPEDKIEEILGLYPTIFEYLTRNRTDSLWREIKRAIDEFQPTPYFKNSFDEYYKQLLASPGEMQSIDEMPIAPSGRDYDFDPKPYLEKLQTRMLLLYGTADELIPVADCIEVIEEINNPIIHLKVYEGAGHGIEIKRNPDILFKPVFPEGYLESLVAFIKHG